MYGGGLNCRSDAARSRQSDGHHNGIPDIPRWTQGESPTVTRQPTPQLPFSELLPKSHGFTGIHLGGRLTIRPRGPSNHRWLPKTQLPHTSWRLGMRDNEHN